jgi:hypothetical protein
MRMMFRRRFLVLGWLVLALGLSGAPLPFAAGLRAASLPSRLTDQEFWHLSSESSEPSGFFRSDNLLSNELGFQYVVPDLVRTTRPGRVYMGVGPEQNFTYIVATKPAMAFIVDVRRGNLHLQLMYKALFELSADRAEFVSRLFAKKRPAGLTAKSTAAEIFDAFWDVTTDEALFKANLQAIDDLLVTKHGFALSEEDRQGIAYVYNAFYFYGPRIDYSSTASAGASRQPNYADLMTATDMSGIAHSFLASDENFEFMKDLESRNLVVPVVGNFGGPKAIRAVGAYLKARDATVSAFYLSNVEQYLYQDRIWDKFCANVAALPLDETSTFIRSVRRGGATTAPGFGLASELGNMASGVRNCGP